MQQKENNTRSYSRIAVFTMNADNTWDRISMEAEAKRAPKVHIKGTSIEQRTQDSPQRLPEAIKQPYINSAGLYSPSQSDARKQQLLVDIKATRKEIRCLMTDVIDEQGYIVHKRVDSRKAWSAVKAIRHSHKLIMSIFVISSYEKINKQ